MKVSGDSRTEKLYDSVRQRILLVMSTFHTSTTPDLACYWQIRHSLTRNLVSSYLGLAQSSMWNTVMPYYPVLYLAGRFSCLFGENVTQVGELFSLDWSHIITLRLGVLLLTKLPGKCSSHIGLLIRRIWKLVVFYSICKILTHFGLVNRLT